MKRRNDKMGRKMYLIIGCLLVLLTSIVTQSSAGVNVNIGVNVPLPALVIPAPPPVLPIPGSYVYYAPDVTVDIFFFHGYWYRPHEGRWYKSHHYNGPWKFTSPARLPRQLHDIPRDFRSGPPDRKHIPYGQLKKNWGKWERERHWDKHDRWQEERRERREEMREKHEERHNEMRERREERREDRRDDRPGRGEGRGR